MTQMTSPLRSLCLEHLERLKQSIGDLRLAVVSSTDGFPIATLGVEAASGRKATAMAAALDGLSKSIAKEFAMGGLEGVVMECELGLVLCRQVHGINRNLVLLLILGREVNYGQALWSIKQAAQDIGNSLQGLMETSASTQPIVKE